MDVLSSTPTASSEPMETTSLTASSSFWPLLALEGMKVLEIPWPMIAAVFVGSAFVGLFAALVPAFRAGRMNVLNAIASDG